MKREASDPGSDVAKQSRTSTRFVHVGKPFRDRIGVMKAKLVVPEEFDEPLPDDIFDSFEASME